MSTENGNLNENQLDKLEAYRRKPLVLTREDVEHLSQLEQMAVPVLRRHGFLKILEDPGC